MSLKYIFAIFALTILLSSNTMAFCKLIKSLQPLSIEGDRMKFEKTNFTFILPQNWKHNWNRNKTELIITPPNTSPPAEFVKMTVRNLTNTEEEINIKDLIVKQSKEIIKISPIPIKLKPLVGPEFMRIGNLTAGRYIAEADPFGNGILIYEGYIAGVKDELNKKVLFVYSAYTQKKSKMMRNGLDMILKNIK